MDNLSNDLFSTYFRLRLVHIRTPLITSRVPQRSSTLLHTVVLVAPIEHR